MVLLRLTVKIPPPEIVQNRRHSTNSVPQGKPTSFLLVLRNPEQVTLGELTWMITEKWSKLRPDAGPLQIKKLLDDEHDSHDLDLDLTAADVFVDNGKAARDGLDQRATVRVVQAPSTKAPFRYGSVVQDWNAVSDHYARVNASRPRPPVPLFPGLESSQRGFAAGRVLPSVTEVNPPSLTVPVPEVAESVYNDGDTDLTDRRRAEMSPVLGDDPGPAAPSSPGPILIPSLASGVRLSLDAQSAALRAPDSQRQEKPATRRRSVRVSLIDRLSITKDDLSPKAATRGAKRRRSSFKPSKLHDSPPAKKQITSKTGPARPGSSPVVSVVIPAIRTTAPLREITPAQPPQEPQVQANTEAGQEPDTRPEPASIPSRIGDAKGTPEPNLQTSPARDRQPSPELNHEPLPEAPAANDKASPALSSREQSPNEEESQSYARAQQESEASERPSTPRERTGTKYPPPFVTATSLLPPEKEPGDLPTVPLVEPNSARDDSTVPGAMASSEMPDEPGADPMEVDIPPAVQPQTMDSEQTVVQHSQVDEMEVEAESLVKHPGPDATESSSEESDVVESNSEPPAGDSTAEKPTTEEPAAGQPTAEEPTAEEPTAEEPTAKEPTAEEPTTEKSNAMETTADEPIAETATNEETAVEKSTVKEPTVEESVIEESDSQESSVESAPKDSKATASGAAEAESSESESTSESSAAEQSPVKSTPPRSPAKRRLSTHGIERVDLSPETKKSSRPGPGPGQMGLGITASPSKPRRKQTAKRQGMSMAEMQRHTNGKTPSPLFPQHARNSATTMNGSSKAGLLNPPDSSSSTPDHSAPESELNLRKEIKLAEGRKKPARVVRQMEEILGLMRELRAAKKNNKNTLAGRLQKRLDERCRALEEQGYKTPAETDVNGGDSQPEIPSKEISTPVQPPTLLPSPIINTQSSSHSSSKPSREDVPLVRGRKLTISPVGPRARNIHDGDEKHQGDMSPVLKKEAQSECVHESTSDSSASGSTSASYAEPSEIKESKAKPGSEFDSDAESAFEDLSTPSKAKANQKPSKEPSDSSQTSSSEEEPEKKPSKPVTKSRPKSNGKAKVKPAEPSSSDSSDSDSGDAFGGDIPFQPLKKTAPTNLPRTRGLGRARNAARLQAATPQPQPASSPFAEREKSAFSTFSQPARRQSSVASVATPGRRPRTNLKELMSTMKRA